MPAVLLTILKIIGIVLVSLLALVLILAAVILFVPIRYSLKARKDTAGDDPTASAKVTFLLHFISAGAVYDKDFSYYVRILGIKIRPRRKRNGDDAETITEPAPVENVFQGSSDKNDKTCDQDVSDEDLSSDDFTVDWNEDESPSPDERDLYDKLEGYIQSIVSKYDRLSERYRKFRKNARYWDKMANDSRNREAVIFIKDLLLKVLRKIVPRSVKGFIHFGTDDPALTGKILMYLAMLYPILPKKLVIEPGFEDKDIYGNTVIRGHIRLITIGIAALRLITNKDCRRMWRLYKKHTG